MMKIVAALGIGILLVAGAALAQPEVVWTLPKLTEPPTLDGARGEAEWANAVTEECSPSKVMEDGENYGWVDEPSQNSERGINQLIGNLGEEEDADEAGTDADLKTNLWIAWDEDALYYIHEVADNYHDTTQDAGGNPVAWWERDSVSLYIDLTNSNVGGGGELYEAMNILTLLADPQPSSNVTVSFIYIDAGARVDTQEPDIIADIEYGYRDAGEEFGGAEDYVIEAMVPWDTFMQFNLPAAPTAGSVMGIEWVMPDPDIAPGWNGQMQCMGGGDFPATYDDIVFSELQAGPGSVSAVESDSWGRIKSTFTE